MAARSIEDIKALRPFPSQDSPIGYGFYTVAAQQQQELVPPDAHTHAKVWFRTPPLTLDTIKHIDSVRLYAESHDQGNAQELYWGNWTWFELAIMKDSKAEHPIVDADGVELVWKSHRNRFQTSNFGWEKGQAFTEDGDMLHLLEDGNVIAIRICGKYTWSKIVAGSGYLVIEIGDAEVDRKDVQYTKVVSEISMVEKVLNEANVQTKAPDKPQLPRKSIQQADAYATANKRPLRVLSLDGGGVRGLASLRLLRAVFREAYPNKKPWQVFDMIGGTSTGG
ncbi:hypothetical protein E8E11_007435 [Didymella keratinophila]|nr:hypothetical protein E8E11_007435 [Didymella keratinophila]